MDGIARRNRNNRKRGTAAELDMAKMLGGRKVGPLGQPWDVEVPGYSRLQVKKLATMPSLNRVATLLDAIPPTPELRGVVVVEASGRGRKARSFVVFYADEYARWHGGGEA